MMPIKPIPPKPTNKPAKRVAINLEKHNSYERTPGVVPAPKPIKKGTI